MESVRVKAPIRQGYGRPRAVELLSEPSRVSVGAFPDFVPAHKPHPLRDPGLTPAPPRREASAAVRAHASFCDIASVPIEPDVRRGPLLVSPRSSRAVGAGVVIVFVARGARLACAFA